MLALAVTTVGIATAATGDPPPPKQAGATALVAQVTVPVGSTVEAPVIPQVAIRPSERGFLAFVVEGDVAHERELQLGLSTADGRVEVKSGVKVGEKLVVRGAEALRDGAKVRVTEGTGVPTAAPAASLGGAP